MLDATFFNKNANLYLLSKLRFRDFFRNGAFLDYESLNNIFGIQLTQGVYFRLRSSLLWTLKSKTSVVAGKSSDIVTFFGSFKKGSKKWRKILQQSLLDEIRVLELTSVRTFLSVSLLDGAEQDEKIIKKAISFWNYSFLPNHFREFLYKFYYNKLGINTRTSHFGGDSRLCTFCTLRGGLSNDETFAHLFFDCPTVKLVHRQIDSTLLNLEYDANYNCRIRWMGLCLPTKNNIFLQLFHLGIQYFIWQAKLRVSLPSVDFIVNETVHILDMAVEKNFDMHFGKSNLNNTLSRHWNFLRTRRW